MRLVLSLYALLWNQGWLPKRVGKSIYKAMRRHKVAPNYPFSGNLFDLKYEGNLRNSIDYDIYYFGAFEKPLLYFLRDCIRSFESDPNALHPIVFYDIGANIGQHSLFMSQYVQLVHCFEPFDGVSKRIRHQIALNNIDNITIHQVGLGSEDAKLPFFAPTGSNQGIGSFEASTTAKGNKCIGELQLVNADDYIAKQGLAAASLIKMDVEGFEKLALMGLKKTLHKERPIVVFEITYEGQNAFKSKEEILALFPGKYHLLTFKIRKKNGSKSRRKQGKARLTGRYELVSYNFEFPWGQDDIVACPEEKLSNLPLTNLNH